MSKTVHKDERKTSKWIAINKARNFKVTHTGTRPEPSDDEVPWSMKVRVKAPFKRV